MGIFPYQTPVEYNRMTRKIKHFDDFCALKGYVKLFDHGSGGNWMDSNGVHHRVSSAPWVGKNGKSYTDREEFRKDLGWYPCLIKDGVVYGWAEPRDLDNYKDPFEQERNFLLGLGYTYAKTGWRSDDYIKNINLEAAFYEKHGWLPRWQKDGEEFGEPELLVKLGYEYKGEPEFPVLVPSDFEKPKGWW